ncbi:MAG: alpha-L-fucosidase [Bryobacteraceae bacterium]
MACLSIFAVRVCRNRTGRFQGTRESLESYSIPEWFGDAKFGIGRTGGPQSAPEAADWYLRDMGVCYSNFGLSDSKYQPTRNAAKAGPEKYTAGIWKTAARKHRVRIDPRRICI